MTEHVEQYLAELLQLPKEDVIPGIVYDLLEQIGPIKSVAILIDLDLAESKLKPDTQVLLKDIVTRTERLETIIEAMKRYDAMMGKQGIS
jgi:hypothetical protein